MQAAARLVVGVDARGRSIATSLYGEAPLLLRRTGQAAAGDPLNVHLVGGAAGPLGGDRLDLNVEVGAGSSLRVRSVAASLAQPGAAGGSSAAKTAVHVAAGATLDWWPEPLVSVARSDHTVHTHLEVAAGGIARWVEEVQLGRHAEPGGRLMVHQRVTVDGAPVLCHTVRFGASSDRATVTAIEVGRPPQPASAEVRHDLRVARFPLGENATAWIGLGSHLDVVRAALCHLSLNR